MDRDDYRRGIQTLKQKIKELADIQREAKRALRMPRKTKEDRERLQAEVDRLSPSKYGYRHDVTYVQSEAAVRRFQISAYLNVYAQVRGKAPCHTPRMGWDYYLPRYMKEAREEFEKACGTTWAQCSAQSPTGRST